MAELQRRKVHGNTPILITLRIPEGHLPTGFIEHPLADRDDQAGLFRQLNKRGRQQQALLRMLPAQQRLGPYRNATDGVELGLVVQAKLLVLDGVAQVLQQLQLFSRIGVH